MAQAHTLAPSARARRVNGRESSQVILLTSSRERPFAAPRTSSGSQRSGGPVSRRASACGGPASERRSSSHHKTRCRASRVARIQLLLLKEKQKLLLRERYQYPSWVVNLRASAAERIR